MGDKSPKKQAPVKKLSTKEKQDRKRSKRDAAVAGTRSIPASAKGKTK